MKQMYPLQSKKAFLALAVTASFIVSGFAVSAQGENSVSSTSNSLPALILSFTAEMRSVTAVLTWEMENQTNCKWFIIDRSGNGSTFDSIATVTGRNNTHHTTYNFTDARVLSGNNYYRLRQVDMDGTVKYSKVVCLNLAATGGKMKVYPNPAAAVVTYSLEIPAAEQITVQVYNLAGVVVMSNQQALGGGANQRSIAISALKNGNYFLKISGDNGTQYAQSFVKML